MSIGDFDANLLSGDDDCGVVELLVNLSGGLVGEEGISSGAGPIS